MKIVYCDVFIGGMDQSLTELLCENSSNGNTYAIAGSSGFLPSCARHRTVLLEGFTVTEICRDDNFITLFGYTDREPLVRIHTICLIFDNEKKEWSQPAMEAGFIGCVTPENPGEEDFAVDSPGVYPLGSDGETNLKLISSAINRYLVDVDSNCLCRA